MITDIEAKLAEVEKAPELAAIPETLPEMNTAQLDRASGNKTGKTNGKESEKSSVLQDLTAKKADPKKPGRGRKNSARTEEAR